MLLAVSKLTKILRRVPPTRIYSTNSIRYKSSQYLKVVVCGAAGNIGQPLSLMLKQSPYIDVLALYDLKECGSVANELSYIDTACKVHAYNQTSCIEALKNANVAVVVAGSGGYKPSISKFDQNAAICRELAVYIAQYCPKTLIAVATDPIEAMVPLMAEVLKEKAVFDPKKLFGITTLNQVRANTFVAETLGIEPECVAVPVIGGTVGETIIPLLSHAIPCNEFTEQEIEKITKSVQNARENVINLQCDEGESLSMAFSIARFVISLIKALKGQQNISEYSFVRTDENPNVKFMTVPVILGPNGIQKELTLPSLTPYEQCLFDIALPTLSSYAEKAKGFLGIKPPEPCHPCSHNPACPIDWCEKRQKKDLQEL